MSEKYLISKEDFEKILMKYEDFSLSPETIKLLLKKMVPFLYKKKEEKSIDELVNEVCEKLPEEYEITIFLERKNAAIGLLLPGFDSYTFYEIDDEDTIESKLMEAFNDACKNERKV